MESASQNIPHNDAFFDYGANLLTALANRNRLVILDILIQGEISVTALAERMNVGQSALSQHLTKLRGARLVTRRRQAQAVYYSCRSDAVKKILRTLEEIYPDFQLTQI
jgi:ArsR family transcriptional regulator, virulence genes transcriptional regulator